MTDKPYKPIRMTREQIRKGLDSVPMDTILLGVNSGATLSPKDREFARMVALGESKAQAYRKTRNSKGNKTTHAANGYKVSRKAEVQQMIEVFAQAKVFAESHTPEQMRSFVLQQLAQHAANEDFPPSARLKALELIGKHSGIDSFVNRSEVVHIKQSGDIRSRILDKLKLIGASTTIEANSIQDDAQDADSLLLELEAVESDPIPDENEQDDTHATHPPPELGVELSDDTHTIPHNRISSEPVWREESATSVDDIEGATVTHSSDALSTQSEPTQGG